MKILVVDNGTSYLEKLKELLAGHEVVVEKFGVVELDRARGFDLVLLSGGHELPVVGNEKSFEKEIALVQDADIPILGICLGFELIAHVFGSTLKRRPEKKEGILEIRPSTASPLFLGIEDFHVYECHRWVVDQISDELIELATSKDGIEMIQYKDEPIYGFQFHPEMFLIETVGDDIFRNLLNEIQQEPAGLYAEEVSRTREDVG